VRPDLAAGDYRDPGWYAHPKGSAAYEWTGAPPATTSAAPAKGEAVELRARKPGDHSHH